MDKDVQSASRRDFLKVSTAAFIATAGWISPRAAKGASGAPVIIGHQCDLTGGISSWGYWHDKAAKAAVAEINKAGGIAGREVTLVTEDDETNPTVGARKFRRLIQYHNADFVIGSVHSGVNIASTPVAKELQTVYIPQGMAAEMTEDKGNRYVFRVGSDTYSQAAAGAPWVSSNLGKTWSFIFADYAWGWSHFNEHKKVIEGVGGKVLAEIPVPQGNKDFIPYLAKVPAGTDELYSIFFGADSVAYFTQSKELGLDKRMARYTVLCTHESISPKDIQGASEGIYLLEYLPRQLKFKDTAYNRKLRELVQIDPVDGREAGGNRVVASSHYWAVWESVWLIKEGIEKSGWKTKKDTPEWIKAVEGMQLKESFSHPQGDKFIRAQDHKAVIDFWMSRVENGEINVKFKIAKEEVSKKFPPRVDLTKETF